MVTVYARTRKFKLFGVLLMKPKKMIIALLMTMASFSVTSIETDASSQNDKEEQTEREEEQTEREAIYLKSLLEEPGCNKWPEC
jgi:hypothetical protein